MKKHFLLAIFLLASFHGIFYGQRFQVTTGSNLAEEQWAVVDDPALNRYVGIGNMTRNGVSRLWIASYDNNGVVQTSALATTGLPMIARDISLAPAYLGQPTYYVTGWASDDLNGLTHRMFVGRVRLDGSFLWYKQSPMPPSATMMEGVALVTAPNRDVVVVGHIAAGGIITSTFQVYLVRFDSQGNLVWGYTYNGSGNGRGNWKARGINLGVATPSCPVSARAPDYFIVTGEVTDLEYRTPGLTGTHTFAALYNGDGNECWRNIYPAMVGTVSADAGYDVVYEPATASYCVVGVAQTGPIRESANSTPYLLRLAPSGAILAGAVYFFNATPLGYYPRCVALDFNPTLGGVVFAGPSYRNTILGNNNGNNSVFWGRMPPIVAPLPNLATGFYNGNGTSIGVPQPFWLDNAIHESIVSPARGNTAGFLISANARPGAFGNGDAHLIRTDGGGATPNNCMFILSPAFPDPVTVVEYSGSSRLAEAYFGDVATTTGELPVGQTFCKDECTISGSFSYQGVYEGQGETITFTANATGNGYLLYEWDFGDGTSSGISPSNQTVSHNYPGGVFRVCLTVYNVNASGDTCKVKYCKDITVSGVVLGDVVGLTKQRPKYGNELIIYPNPITDQLSLQVLLPGATTAAVQIFNAKGISVYQIGTKLVNGKSLLVIPTKDWPSGTYIAKVIGNDATIAKQFVKN